MKCWDAGGATTHQGKKGDAGGATTHQGKKGDAGGATTHQGKKGDAGGATTHQGKKGDQAMPQLLEQSCSSQWIGQRPSLSRSLPNS